MKIRNLLCSGVIFTSVIFLTCAYADDMGKTVIVNDAWVQVMPDTPSKAPAYMIIMNNSFKDIVLTSVSSDVAGVGEIHKMSESSGAGNGSPVSQLAIPALGRLLLQPTSVHFMLIGLKKPIHKGDIVPIVLHFQGGGTVLVNAVVKMQYGD